MRSWNGRNSFMCGKLPEGRYAPTLSIPVCSALGAVSRQKAGDTVNTHKFSLRGEMYMSLLLVTQAPPIIVPLWSLFREQASFHFNSGIYRIYGSAEMLPSLLGSLYLAKIWLPFLRFCTPNSLTFTNVSVPSIFICVCSCLQFKVCTLESTFSDHSFFKIRYNKTVVYPVLETQAFESGTLKWKHVPLEKVPSHH